MRRRYDNIMTVVDNEDGMTMVITLMILLLLTVIGVAAITTSTTETMISSAETEKRSTYYAAESGAEHATIILRTLCIPNNQPKINRCRTSTSMNCNVEWNFALEGPEDSNTPAKLVSSSDPSLMERFEAGAIWIQKDIDSFYNYDVRVWDNNDAIFSPDDPDRTTDETDPVYIERYNKRHLIDTDGKIHLVAIGTGPNKGKSAVEVVLAAYIDGSGLSSYMGQQAGGSGKNSNALDTGRMMDTEVSSLAQIIP